MVLSKEEYRKMGVPVGVGAPETPQQTPEERIQEHIDSREEDEMTRAMALNDSGGAYTQRLAPGDKARIVQFINTNQPYKKEYTLNPMSKELEMNVTDGEIDLDMFMAFNGWLAHNSGMGYLDDRELKIEECNLDITEMEVRMAMPRSLYTPKMNAKMRNAKHLSKIRLYQNKDGMERYLSAAEIQEDLKAFKILKSKTPGKLANVYNAARGRSEQ